MSYYFYSVCCLGSLAMFVVVQNPTFFHNGKEFFQIFQRQGQFCLAKLYEFPPTCTDSSPEVVGKKEAKKFPCVAGKKSDFSTRGILATHQNLSRQMVSWEKTPWLSMAKRESAITVTSGSVFLSHDAREEGINPIG